MIQVIHETVLLCNNGDEMKKYLLKEYGSWGVMLLSFLTGLLVGGGFSPHVIFALAAISLYINSKQALKLWIRQAQKTENNHKVWFFVQVLIATALMIPVIGKDTIKLLPYASVPLVYLVLLKTAGEHNILTEISGFVLLSFSALIAKFSATHEIDPLLFASVAVFFVAGVFKVRLQLTKKKRERLLMAGYAAFAIVFYLAAGAPLVALVPLLDNLVFALVLYRVKLDVIGWLEVAKGVIFLVLMAVSY